MAEYLEQKRKRRLLMPYENIAVRYGEQSQSGKAYCMNSSDFISLAYHF